MTQAQPLEPVLMYRACPACGALNSFPFGRKADFDVLQCKDCACLYVRPEPTVQQLDEFYRAYSYGVYVPPPSFIREQLRRQVVGFEPFRKTGLLIDVGCGAGEFLDAAGGLGWNASGLECSRSAVMLARSRGLSVDEGDFLTAVLPTNFDVAVMSELLEHVMDPKAFIKRAFDVLRPGGLLYATTPNGDSLSRRIMGLAWSTIAPPEHLQLFNAASLAQLLHNCGFRYVRVESRGLNVYALRDYFRKPRCQEESLPSRNENAFKLNEQLTRSPIRRVLKGILNSPLRLLGLGDSLRVWAQKPS